MAKPVAELGANPGLPTVRRANGEEESSHGSVGGGGALKARKDNERRGCSVGQDIKGHLIRDVATGREPDDVCEGE